jgi:hypothetical protein
MRTAAEVERVIQLSRSGLNNCAISRRTGIPRSTIVGWVNGSPSRRGHERSKQGCRRCGDQREPFPNLVDFAYSYLLGIYLGDGCLLRHPRGVYRLHIMLDTAYPVIAAEVAAAMQLTMPDRKVRVSKHKTAAMYLIDGYSKHWPCLFPQHGAGLKHRRSIGLDPWQRKIADRYPGRLLRGLIHSDGCRVQNTIRHPKKTYMYPRYFFSNRSRDIQSIFCDACDRLGIMWRQDGPWNISIARRESVRILDRHIGPKR